MKKMWAVFDRLAQPERVSSTRRNVMLLLFVVSVFVDLLDDLFGL